VVWNQIIQGIVHPLRRLLRSGINSPILIPHRHEHSFKICRTGRICLCLSSLRMSSIPAHYAFLSFASSFLCMTGSDIPFFCALSCLDRYSAC